MSGGDLAALVIGGAKEEFARQASNELAKAGIPYQRFNDIYSAAAYLATTYEHRPLFITGRMTALCVEDMRFFSFAASKRKTFFCCLRDKHLPAERAKHFPIALADISIVNSGEEFAETIENCLFRCKTEPPAAKENSGDFTSRITSLADKFFLTQAEQDMLLGVHSNANTDL